MVSDRIVTDIHDACVRVDAGVQWLDQHIPDWLNRIDLSLLDISSSRFCLLGQLGCPDANNVLRFSFHRMKEYYDLSVERCAAYGFAVDCWHYNSNESMSHAMDLLTNAWCDVIVRRRQAGLEQLKGELVGV